jgi:hypothetical protein
MTARGLAIAEVLRGAFDALTELDKHAPGDVDALVAVVVAHLRAWRPVAVAPLGVLPPPGEPIRDPRGESPR